MLGIYTRSWWLFPPRTQELQLDEKWAFVYRKQKHCDLQKAEDHRRGDCWDHVAFDPEHRLVLGVIFGKRSATRIVKLMRKVKEQLRDRVPRLITSDEFSAYPTVLKLLWPAAAPPQKDRRCTTRPRPPKPPRPWPRPALNYATVCKRRDKGRVVEVTTAVVYGSPASVARALEQSPVSTVVNTSFLERHHATDRHRNARKARRTYRFSKDWQMHEDVGYFSYYTYNFCWCVRSLRKRLGGHRPGPQRYRRCTPAMSAGLSDHTWSLREWLSRPIPGLST